jgi:chorismate synthase
MKNSIHIAWTPRPAYRRILAYIKIPVQGFFSFKDGKNTLTYNKEVLGMRFIDAGESHGRMLAAIIEGIPSNIEVDTDFIDHELEKRQSGFGRGGRMKIEKDRVEIATGMRNGKTTGAPVTMIIKNIDHVNWAEEMDGDIREVVTRPRPGHADLNGVLKYNLKDIRDVIERASARETAMRTAVGAFAAVFLKQFGIRGAWLYTDRQSY